VLEGRWPCETRGRRWDERRARRRALTNDRLKNDQTSQQATTSAQATPTSSVASTASARASSPASSTYIPPAATAVALIDITCPSSLRAWDGKRYDCTELRNIQGGDITGISAYSLQQCIHACSTFSSRPGNKNCKAVAIGPALEHAYNINSGANCWLKESATPLTVYTAGPGVVGGTIAVLQD
jgi:hypothetical protein